MKFWKLTKTLIDCFVYESLKMFSFMDRKRLNKIDFGFQEKDQSSIHLSLLFYA